MMTDAPEKRLNELALRCAHSGRTQFTKFLEPSMEAAARAVASRAGVQLALWGGYEEAERRVAAFYDLEPPEPEAYPLTALRIQWNAKFANPGHRDLLGALMGLGIDRETTGDIAMGTWKGEGCAYLFALEEMADYIVASYESAGRASVRVTAQAEPPELLPPEGETLRLTVQQARLDAVVAAACRLSRSESQRLITAGLVKLNHVPCLRTDARVEEGDMLSMRGFGRAKVVGFMGESRRGRQVLAVFKYK